MACYQDIDKTAAQLGADESTYRKFMRTRIEDWPLVSNDILAPIKIPENPLQFLDFGRSAILSARTFTRLKFKTEESKVLFYGAAAHSTLPLNSTASASFGLVLMIMAHLNGWPFPKSGAGQIIEALAKYYIHVGGEVKVNSAIEDFNQIPNSKVQVFDLTPKQLLTIKSLPLSALYQKRLSNFMLWDLSYAELVFSEKNWPEFATSDFLLAIDEYYKRDRRYGGSTGEIHHIRMVQSDLA